MGEFSISHIIILLLIFLVFFGPSRLPQLGSSLGKAIREFKDSLSGLNSEKNPENKQTREQLPPAVSEKIEKTSEKETVTQAKDRSKTES